MSEKHNDLSKLIGFQIVSISNTEIKVKNKCGEVFNISIEDDSGDCCGYNDIKTQLFYEEGSQRNPIITGVRQARDVVGDSQSCEVTFFGEHKAIASISTFSSSGSGWYYGATVSVRCDALDIDDILSSW